MPSSFRTAKLLEPNRRGVPSFNSRRLLLRGGAEIEENVEDISGDGGVLKRVFRKVWLPFTLSTQSPFPDSSDTVFEQGTGDEKPILGDELYLRFNATIASLDSGEVIYNDTLIGGKLFDSSEPGGAARIFTLGSDVTNKVA